MAWPPSIGAALNTRAAQRSSCLICFARQQRANPTPGETCGERCGTRARSARRRPLVVDPFLFELATREGRCLVAARLLLVGLSSGTSHLLSAALELTRMLSEGAVTAKRFESLAALDEEAADFLKAIVGLAYDRSGGEGPRKCKRSASRRAPVAQHKLSREVVTFSG
jgi:hypothetical protein